MDNQPMAMASEPALTTHLGDQLKHVGRNFDMVRSVDERLENVLRRYRGQHEVKTDAGPDLEKARIPESHSEIFSNLNQNTSTWLEGIFVKLNELDEIL